MPLTKQHYIMLQRNLLYTGMTRAKRRLVLVADDYSIKKAVSNNVIERRFSMLAERIKQN
jgi:exodeoxyribonuclease V alpha subunit